MSSAACEDVRCGALFAAATELLEACHEALRATPGGTPSRYYVSPGAPALDNFYDTDQLTVHVGQPAASLAATSPTAAPLDAGLRAQSFDQVNLVALTVTIARCVPTFDNDGGLPTNDDLNVASEQLHCDLWAIANYVREAKHQDVLFAPKERALFQESALALEQSGGAGGWIIPFLVQLDGYSPNLAVGC